MHKTDETEWRKWQIAGIEEALRALDRDEGIPHEDVKAWAQSLGTDEELPLPLP
jgi:predicted transcriptional regulator